MSSLTAPAELAGICAEALVEGSPEDGFHMYYTSGTTGTPKGVVLRCGRQRLLAGVELAPTSPACW